MIEKVVSSPRAIKRFRVYLEDGRYFDFGSRNSSTYIDHGNETLKNAYQKRHLGNASEKYLINNLIPSPSLFSYYLLWNTKSLKKNIELLNELLSKKK